MTVFESFKTKNVDEIAEWLDKNGIYDGSPWMHWWDKNYCSKCETVIDYVPDDEGEETWHIGMECAWCELHDKCRFFQDMDDMPDNKQIIKLWLESEIEIGMEVI